MDLVEIRKKIRATVVEQACGEWDDTTIDNDTDLLMKTVVEIVEDAVSLNSLSQPLTVFDGAVDDRLVNPAYILSEPHLSGYRVVLGYQKLSDAGSTLGYLAKLFNALRHGSQLPEDRIQDLLEANNRYLDRARKAEAILNKDVSTFVAEYEFRDVAGDYTPTSVEKTLIEDALASFISEEGVQKEKGLDFSEALQALKAGKAVARAGWNGKGMFLYMVPPATYKAQTLVAKALFGEDVPYGAYTAMKTADGNVVPWLCSQTDQYATDWEIVVV